MGVERPTDMFEARRSGGGMSDPAGAAVAKASGSPARTPSPPSEPVNRGQASPPRDGQLNPARGLDAELQAKQDAKYDVGLEMQVTGWIESITTEKRGDNSFHEWLKDGQVLVS